MKLERWVSRVPAGWRLSRLRFVAKVNPTKREVRALPADREVSFVPMEAVGEWGGLRLDATKSLGDVIDDGFTYFRDGDVVVAKITPCFENGKGALAEGLVGGIGFGTTELHTVRAGPDLEPRFLFYLTMSHPFRSMGAAEMYGAGGQKRVPDSFVDDFVVPVPPRLAQRAIVSFLDRKTAALDSIISAKMRLARILHERREALITKMLVSGVGGAKATLDAGPVLGRIPSHWQLVRAKYFLKLTTSGSRGWGEYFSDTGALFLQSGNLGDALRLDLRTVQRVDPPPGSEGTRTRVAAGDVLVCITGAYTGNVALVDQDLGEAYVNQHIALVRPDATRLSPAFLAYYLASPFGRYQFELAQYGGTKQGLGLDDVRNVVMPLPPCEEQIAIVEALRGQTRALDDAAQLVASSVDGLQKCRSALITAAVAGELDVQAEKEAA
jgi:type I restriction enzyme, S subunit